MRTPLSCLVAAFFAFLQCPIVFGQGTAFTYQGLLSNVGTGQAVNGSYDFVFALYAAATNGTPVAGPITNATIHVSNGVFVTTIDFGDVFTGSNYWLDIAVRTNQSATFIELAPRQPISSTPYAMVANRANNLTGIAASSLVTNNETGVSLTGSFLGNGVGLTNINGSAISSGTIADARLTANAALLNASSQTWNVAGTNIFGAVVISNANTANVPLQIYTNLNATNGNSTMIQMGTVANPAMSYFGLNPGHGGVGDGSEFTIGANQIAIVGTGGSGGRIQVGGQGLVAPWAITLQDVGFASSGVPYTANGGIVDWKYGWWDGSTAFRPQFDTAISSVYVTTGQGTLTTFDAFAPNLR